MNNRVFLAVLLLTILSLNAYPFYQMGATGGHLYYQNAFDETTYLQYDYSRLDGNITRPTQGIVTLAHEAGLSAGWINLVLDLFCLALFPLVLRSVLRELGYGSGEANGLALLGTVAPVLFGGMNPFVSHLFHWSLVHGWAYWMAVPEAWYLPLVRSPEPQLSLVLLGISVLLSLKWKGFWPLYLFIPFLYSYIALPALFIALSLHLRRWLFKTRAEGSWAAPALSAAMVSLLVWADIGFALSADKREMFVRSRLPMASFTACAALALYLLFYRRMEERFRYPALLAAATPLFLVNQQVLTGWFFHPTNYEQYSGVLCASFVLVLAVGGSKVLQRTALGLALLLAGNLGLMTFRMNDQINGKLPWSAALEKALREDPGHVAVNDVGLASRLSMVFPKEPPTLFAYEQIFPPLAPLHFDEYVCAKEAIRRDKGLGADFRDVFDQLDRAYRYNGHDFVLVHVGRKKAFKLWRDPDRMVPGCPPRTLKYFLVERSAGG